VEDGLRCLRRAIQDPGAGADEGNSVRRLSHVDRLPIVIRWLGLREEGIFKSIFTDPISSTPQLAFVATRSRSPWLRRQAVVKPEPIREMAAAPAYAR
jgi:hypothetical protein